jgi:hypothetical protein
VEPIIIKEATSEEMRRKKAEREQHSSYIGIFGCEIATTKQSGTGGGQT